MRTAGWIRDNPDEYAPIDQAPSVHDTVELGENLGLDNVSSSSLPPVSQLNESLPLGAEAINHSEPANFLTTGEKATSTASTAVGATEAGAGMLGSIGSAALGGVALGAFSLIGSAISAPIWEHEQENLIDFKYKKAEQAASQTGMPLANVLGFGGDLPAGTQRKGLSSITTEGQGYTGFPGGATPSSFSNNYVEF